MGTELKQLADVAIESIRNLKAIITEQQFGKDVLHHSGRDITLEADKILNKEITDHLTRLTGINCLSEEDLDSHDLESTDRFWIVDPLDGSVNYLRNIPVYAVSIALWHKEKAILGVIYDFCRDLLFTGYDSHAAVNGEKITVGHEVEPNRSMIATGFPRLMDLSEKSMKNSYLLLSSFNKVRMIGSAALSMAWVAEGKIDLYYERDIMIWDVAAGAAIIEGAGGVCRMLPGNHQNSYHVIAGNHDLVTSMLSCLESQKWQV
jgi:myo-inositol-1(or 4)-monophosphatase